MADADTIRNAITAYFEREDRVELRISAGELATNTDAIAGWARREGYLVHLDTDVLVLRRVSRLARCATPKPASLQAIDRSRKL